MEARLIRTSFAQQSGYYVVGDLPAVPYRAIALASLSRDAWTDPDVLERLRSLATPVRLQEGQQHTLSLKLSPALKGLMP